MSDEPIEGGPATEQPSTFEGTASEAAAAAARELGAMRERGEVPQIAADEGAEEVGEPITRIAYAEGAEPEGELSIKKAAEDLGAFRRQQREELQAALADQAETAQAEQPEIKVTQEQIDRELERQATVEREERRQAEIERARLESQKHYSRFTAAVQQRDAELAQIRSAVQKEFGQLTPAQFTSLPPEKVQRLQQYGKVFQEVSAARETEALRAAAHGAVVMQAEQAAFEAFASVEDQRFEASLPAEFKNNPAAKAELQRDAFRYLESVGLDRQSIKHLWQNDRNMRSAAGQRVILDAVLQMRDREASKIAKQRLNEHKKPVPQVQRPGIAHVRNDGAVEQASARLKGARTEKEQIAAAVELLGAKRQARSSNGQFA
jgi:hypothetical protein